MQLSLPPEALARHGLDDLALDDLLLEARDEALVALLADVAQLVEPCVPLLERLAGGDGRGDDGRLVRERERRRRRDLCGDGLDLGDRGVVRLAHGVVRRRRGVLGVHVRDDVDALEQVVERNDRVVQEEDRVGDPDRVRQVVARRLGLKEPHAVVPDVADRATCCRSRVSSLGPAQLKRKRGRATHR